MKPASCALLLALFGCATATTPPTAPSLMSATPAPEPAAQALDPSAPPRVETQTFMLELSAPSRTSLDEPTPIALVIEGRGGYHVNLEYPLRIELGASAGAQLDQRALELSDARERSEERARFETRARWPAAGRQWLAARLTFAVCTPDTCVPREERLAIAIDVQ